MDFSEKIKKARDVAGLTQEELAHCLGVSLTSVNRWETGKFEPTMQIKKRLYQLFIDAGMQIN